MFERIYQRHSIFINYCVVLVSIATIFMYVLSANSFLVGYDSFFHIKYSQLLGQEHFIDQLPWLQETIHKSAFRDHHLLWHYLLIPFTLGDLIQGGQRAVLLSAIALGLSLYALLRQSAVRTPGIWTIVALLASSPFLFRMSMLRVQSISLVFLLLMFLFYQQRKYLAIFILTVLYVWLYDGFPLFLMFAIVFIASKRLIDKQWDFKILYICLAGIITGMIVNPYFPANLTSIIYNASRSIFFHVNGIKLGNEWSPYSSWSLLKNSLPAFIALGFTIVALAIKDKISSNTFSALVINLIFLLLTFKSRRIIEYWPVFSILTDAMVIGKNQTKKSIIIGFLLLSPLLFNNLNRAHRDIEHTKSPLIYQGASEWLKAHSNRGQVVFNADWDDFPFLFFYNSWNYYIVGLDPMYLYTYDHKKYRLYKRITRGKIKNPAKLIKRKFHASYIFLDREHAALYRKLKRDPFAEQVYKDTTATVFAIRSPAL